MESVRINNGLIIRVIFGAIYMAFFYLGHIPLIRSNIIDGIVFIFSLFAALPALFMFYLPIGDFLGGFFAFCYFLISGYMLGELWNKNNSLYSKRWIVLIIYLASNIILFLAESHIFLKYFYLKQS